MVEKIIILAKRCRQQLFLWSGSYFFIPQVKTAYVNFVNHCYVDTEVEMKEIYTSNHIWKLFDNFLVDMSSVRLCQI